MSQREVTINNKAGIHCRPGSVILTKIQEYPDNNFRVITAEGESDLTSILSLLSLGLQEGDTATVEVTGPNDEAVCAEIADLFEFNFDFPPKNEQKN